MHKYFFVFLVIFCGKGYTQNNLVTNNESLEDAKSFVIKQNDETVRKKYPLNPNTASILSAIIPGSGQIYNRKYWKAPIIWGGAISIFLGYDFYKREENFYHQIAIFKDRYSSDEFLKPYIEANKIDFTNEPTDQIANLSLSTVLQRTDNARATKQQLIVLGALFYLIQVVEASVDAHFDGFDVSEDLTMNISPATFNHASWANGLKLSFRF